ncbi:MAG: patatin-like phospholipase family protein, partial [Flavitalea sp.]
VWGISFAYFFGAEKTIVRTMAPLIANPELFRKKFSDEHAWAEDMGRRVNFYLTSTLRLRKPRNVNHYRQEFIEKVFKRHHLAAIASIMLAFFFLVIVGFLIEYPLFEVPAAASILVFFAVMIAVIGSLTYFLQSWSLLAAIILIGFINFLYKNEYIDPRNKAYGLNYSKMKPRPLYDKTSLAKLCSPQQVEKDRMQMLSVLEHWKARQKNEKPVMVFMNVSGGGLRSASFVLNSLQQIDKQLDGQLMDNTFLISGASGGMLAATYYRELYRQKLNGKTIDLSDPRYVDDISGDLLNSIFSSMIARDIFSPAQKFSVGEEKYVKDRGYAFEKKLSDNTHGLLSIQLKDVAKDESTARIPLMVFNSVIKRDGRKMIISTQPMSFLMKPSFWQQDTTSSPDAVDFAALFSERNPMNLRILTALRMNATFPYVLPNVWLPTEPVIDVMDAGLRDNYGVETSLRFIENFEDWIRENTSGVLILQIRDKLPGNWQHPFETNSLTDMLVNPATMLQHNWYKLQDYSQADQYNYFTDSSGYKLHRVNVVYIPEKEDKVAALNFHLSGREKRDVQQSF